MKKPQPFSASELIDKYQETVCPSCRTQIEAGVIERLKAGYKIPDGEGGNWILTRWTKPQKRPGLVLSELKEFQMPEDEWKSQPNSEGWWWHTYKYGMEILNVYDSNQGLMCIFQGSPRLTTNIEGGKWQKAFVPLKAIMPEIKE